MTSATADGHARRDSTIHRVAMWLGHYEPRVVPVVFCALLAACFAYLWIPRWSGVTDGLVTQLIAAAFVLARCGVIHDRNLCRRHIDDTLLDPQGAVDRYRRRMAWCHDIRVRVSTVSLVAGIVAIAAFACSRFAADWPWPARAAITAAALATFPVVVYTTLALRTHRKLQRWCLWCNPGGGGGGHVTAPDPQPVGTSTRG